MQVVPVLNLPVPGSRSPFGTTIFGRRIWYYVSWRVSRLRNSTKLLCWGQKSVESSLCLYRQNQWRLVISPRKWSIWRFLYVTLRSKENSRIKVRILLYYTFHLRIEASKKAKNLRIMESHSFRQQKIAFPMQPII